MDDVGPHPGEAQRGTGLPQRRGRLDGGQRAPDPDADTTRKPLRQRPNEDGMDASKRHGMRTNPAHPVRDFPLNNQHAHPLSGFNVQQPQRPAPFKLPNVLREDQFDKPATPLPRRGLQQQPRGNREPLQHQLIKRQRLTPPKPHAPRPRNLPNHPTHKTSHPTQNTDEGTTRNTARVITQATAQHAARHTAQVIARHAPRHAARVVARVIAQGGGWSVTRDTNSHVAWDVGRGGGSGGWVGAEGQAGGGVGEAGGALGEPGGLADEGLRADLRRDQSVEEADHPDGVLRIGVQRRKPQEQALHDGSVRHPTVGGLRAGFLRRMAAGQAGPDAGHWGRTPRERSPW
ncbi:hypothetical protein GCM10009735_72320 [Actinomadura chokoriensis]